MILTAEQMDQKLEEALKFHDQRKAPEAEKAYKEILESDPDWCVAHWNYGRLLHECKAFKRAAEEYTKAILSKDVCPDGKANSMNNLGLIMDKWGKKELAMQSYENALRLEPKHYEATVNLCAIRRFFGNMPGAVESVRKALLLKKDGAEAHCENAFLMLTTGDYVRGWKEFEWRWKWPGFVTPPLPTKKPRWEGQRYPDKTVLITQEQGIGDTIQFMRYAPMVKERVGTVRAFVPIELIRLLEANRHLGVDAYQPVYVTNQENFDCHIPTMSLPRIFNTTLKNIPAEPYIGWPEMEELPGKFRVGIVWAGRPEHGNDRFRSMKLEQFAPLFEVDWMTFYSLQWGHEEDLKQFPNVTNLMGNVKDYADTARLLNSIDLLISVDTSIIHLAGAMGKTVWALIPYSPDFRWMLQREDSPWYPTMKLFRQNKKDDWGTVIQCVKSLLEQVHICSE